MNNGLLYHSFWNRSSGSSRLDLPQAPFHRFALYEFRDHRKIVVKPLRILASMLFLAGSAGLLLTFLPVAAMEIKYRIANSSLLTAQSPSQKAVSGALSAVSGPTNDMDAFSISIPKIEAQSIVVPNVDASDPKAYMPALQKGVAHAIGSGLPGVESSINRTIYLFAHSTSAPWLVTKNNAQFY